MAIKIVTDSTCDIDLDVLKNLDVEVACLRVNFGDSEYIDNVTITKEEFFKKLETSKALPTTSLINTPQFVEIFSKYPNDDIIGIFLSSTFSGTFNSARLAKEETRRDNIHLIDSNTVTLGLALLIHEAVKMKKAGMKANEICNAIEELKKKVEVYAVVDTFN